MNLSLSYSEVSALIKAKIGYDVAFSYVDENTVKVETIITTSIPFLKQELSKTLTALISNLSLSGTCLQFNYRAGVANCIAPFLTKLFPMQIVEAGIVSFNAETISIRLDKIEKANDVLNFINIERIAFAEGIAILEFSLRN